MINASEFEKDNIIKVIKNIFRLKIEMDDGTVKSISNLFKKNEENEAIKDRIIRDIKTL